MTGGPDTALLLGAAHAWLAEDPDPVVADAARWAVQRLEKAR